MYWENGGRGVVSASAQKTAEISLPVAITVFPEEIYRAPETWARRAYPNVIYFHESPQMQISELRDYAQRRGLEIAGEYVDLASGAKDPPSEGKLWSIESSRAGTMAPAPPGA